MNPAIVPLSQDITQNLDTFSQRATGAFAPNTQRAFRADTEQFALWCTAHHRQSLPASVETVEAFIQAMAASKAPATVRRYVSSIAKMHEAAAVLNPVTDPITGKYRQPIQLAMKTMHRTKGRRQKQVKGMTFDIRSRLLEKIDTATAKGLRDRALITVAYDTAFRRSELVALDLPDLQATPDGLATLLLRKSKTDQEGEGSHVLIARDTFEYLKAWIELSAIKEGPVFRSIRKGGKIHNRLTDQSVRLILKERATQSGLPAAIVETLSGHSPRVGLAQDMTASGLDLPAIMQAGRWKSPQMVSRYTEHLQARKGGAAKLFALQHRLIGQ
jgi:site-specific recombinase XerD